MPGNDKSPVYEWWKKNQNCEVEKPQSAGQGQFFSLDAVTDRLMDGRKVDLKQMGNDVIERDASVAKEQAESLGLATTSYTSSPPPAGPKR